MFNYSNILLVLLICSILFFIAYCVKIIKDISANRIETRKQDRIDYYPLACAGSYTSGIGEKGISVSINRNHFFTPEGATIDSRAYTQYVVSGNSMSLCGIFNSNLLYVKKDFKVENLIDLPKILVIKRRDAKIGEVQYKVRRTWFKCTINDNLEEILNTIIKSSKFQSILNSSECPDVTVLIEDFKKERLHRYEVNYPDAHDDKSEYHHIIISTTLHTDIEKGIRFSIHPIKDIMGIVEYSFTIPQTILN